MRLPCKFKLVAEDKESANFDTRGQKLRSEMQSRYHAKTRQQLQSRYSTKSVLKVTTGEEFALHRDRRTSFGLSVGLKFEGPYDEDSDTEIEKMVNDLQAKLELKAIEEVPILIIAV